MFYVPVGTIVSTEINTMTFLQYVSTFNENFSTFEVPML